jgi:hypothetical protein
VDPLCQYGLSASKRAGLPVLGEQNPCHNKRKILEDIKSKYKRKIRG